MTEADALSSPALPIILALEAAGFRFRLNADGRLEVNPSRQLSAEQREILRAHDTAARLIVQIGADEHVQARVTEYRRQLAASALGTLPAFVFAPNTPYTRGRCFSCNDSLNELRFGRCARCAIAWRLAARVPIDATMANALDSARTCA